MNSTTSGASGNLWEELPMELRSPARAVALAEPPARDVELFLKGMMNRIPGPVQAGRHGGGGIYRSVRTRRLLAAAAAAACLAVGFLAWNSPHATALELASRALALIRCVKLTTTDVRGSSVEHWYMPVENTSAWRDDRWVEFRDHEIEITYSYDRGDNTLYRVGESASRRNDFILEFVELLRSVQRGETVRQLRGMKVLEIETVAGAAANDPEPQVRLALEDSTEKDRVTAWITFDPSTHLPRIARYEGRRAGQEVRAVMRFDYPANGPADVYALDVPRDVRLVDRIPATDVKRLVAGVYAGRRRFDDYRAIVLQSPQVEEKFVENYDARLIAKKGDKVLLLQAQQLSNSLDGRELPKDREELAAYLLARVDQFRWMPYTLVDGQTQYVFDVSFSSQDAAAPLMRVDDVRRIEFHGDAKEFVVPGWHWYPHLAGRPPLGVGRQDIAAALAREASDGPEGCVLLQTSRSGRLSEAPAAGDPRAGRLERGGYWIRPDREFLVMLDDSLFAGAQSAKFVIEELQQSPQGHWYPMRLRADFGANGGDAPAPVISSYHLDFSEMAPDAWFDPEYDWSK